MEISLHQLNHNCKQKVANNESVATAIPSECVELDTI